MLKSSIKSLHNAGTVRQRFRAKWLGIFIVLGLGDKYHHRQLKEWTGNAEALMLLMQQL